MSREKEQTAAREKEVLRRFAYLEDRRRAGLQQPADAGVEQRRPSGRLSRGQGWEIAPSRTRRRVLRCERVGELSVRASQDEDDKLDLVLGELVKIMKMLDKGYGASKG